MKSLSIYTEKIKNNKNSLFNSILFLILGVILFTNPCGILGFLSYIAGGFLVIVGLFNILNYRKTLKKLNIEDTPKLITGIILIILGLIIALFSSFITTTIRLVCGGWIIYNGVLKLIEAMNYKDDKTLLYSGLGIAILIIICGFYVALSANLVFSLVGLFIMIYAILDIAGYIIYKKLKKRITSFLL